MFSEVARVRGKARRAGNGHSPYQAAQRRPRARAASPTNEWINKWERLCAPITALRSLTRAMAMAMLARLVLEAHKRSEHVKIPVAGYQNVRPR